MARTALLAIALGFLLSTGAAAGASTEPLPSGTPSISVAVVSPASPAIAFLVGEGILRVQVPGNSTRDYAVPASCRGPLALASDAVIVCEPSGRGPLALDLDSGLLRPVAVGELTPPGDHETFRLQRAGRYWLEGEVGSYTDTTPHTDVTRVVVIRRTGRVFPAERPTDPERLYDLDAPQPYRRMCAPIRSLLTPADLSDDVALQRVGAWTLRPVYVGRSTRPRAVLQRCGSSRPMLVGQRAVLGRDHAAWLGDPRQRRPIRLRNLRTGSTRSFTWPRVRGVYEPPSFAFSATHLVVSYAGAVTVIPLR